MSFANFPQVLRRSSTQTHQKNLLSVFTATYGIIFLGCPHRGSSAVGLGVVAVNLSQLAGIAANKELVRSLGIGSEILSIINTEFSNFLADGRFKVHSFREEKGMTGIAGISGKVYTYF